MKGQVKVKTANDPTRASF